MDWESFFEGDIIPLVSKARSATALDACFEVVVDALFRRANDGANKEHFRRLYANWVADMPDLDARKEHASRFLRMVKDVRKELAANAKRQPSTEPDDRCSTDIETLAQVAAVEDQDDDDIDEVIDE
ncbi:MAG: hypothetical protein HQL38_11630, partial [Alphaproteobacteria bacterium]|nr:hypothetical protein [Alphaproteobacteria bacterium]